MDCNDFSLHVLAAVGESYQIGLNNKLPWLNISELREIVKQDLKAFKEMTMGKTCIVGHRTALYAPPLYGRSLSIWDGKTDPEQVIHSLLARSVHEAIVIGGAKTYSAFSPYVNGNVWVHRIPYDGPADTYFPIESFFGKKISNKFFLTAKLSSGIN